MVRNSHACMHLHMPACTARCPIYTSIHWTAAKVVVYTCTNMQTYLCCCAPPPPPPLPPASQPPPSSPPFITTILHSCASLNPRRLYAAWGARASMRHMWVHKCHGQVHCNVHPRTLTPPALNANAWACAHIHTYTYIHAHGRLNTM